MAERAPIPVAFYAPMKPPDHPLPSGDRAMARALMAALKEAGFAPRLASRLRSHEKRGDADAQSAIRAEAEAEADRLIALWGDAPASARPALWFTYHLYDRAPDWIGPKVAKALGVPYLAAEASLAPSRANGPWRDGHASVVAALRQAAAVFVLNENDRPCVTDAPELAHAGMAAKCVSLPPFLTRLPDRRVRSPRVPGPTRLLAVAMLRHGDKLRSFRVLADALRRLSSQDWRLTIVGDGPARDVTTALFAPFAERVSMTGAVLDALALDAIYAAHDLLVWPACNEAFGMALLEAQANGCPVLAGDVGGVSGVVRNGLTGWLVPPEPEAAFAQRFAERLDGLLQAEALRPGLLHAAGAAGPAMVDAGHSLAHAAAILRGALTPLVGASALSDGHRSS